MKVNVFVDYEVVAQVKYNALLDQWDGRNWQNGGTGLHLGIAKLENGQYVLIRGSDWQGSRPHAEIISEEEAFQNIIRYNESLLTDPDYPQFHDLQKYQKKLIKEATN